MWAAYSHPKGSKAQLSGGYLRQRQFLLRHRLPTGLFALVTTHLDIRPNIAKIFPSRVAGIRMWLRAGTSGYWIDVRPRYW
jgi:hypothetical protein